MEASDNWDTFLEAYSELKEKYTELVNFTEHVLGKASKWLDEVPQEWFTDFYTITNNTEALELWKEEVTNG